MSKIIPFPPLPSAFTVPHNEEPTARTKLWVQSPSGHFMLLSGSWAFAETARMFAVRCGYKIIGTDVGLALVEHQMNDRMMPADARVH